MKGGSRLALPSIPLQTGVDPHTGRTRSLLVDCWDQGKSLSLQMTSHFQSLPNGAPG